MTNFKMLVFVTGVVVVASGCQKHHGGGQIGNQVETTQNISQPPNDQPGLGVVGEVKAALAEFERGIALDSKGERVDAVFALDKYVRQHEIVVERLIETLRNHKEPAVRGAAARILALTADNGDLDLRKKAASALIAALDDKGQFAGETPAWISPDSVRREAADGLKAFGELASPAVGKLGDLAADAEAVDVSARIAATEALGKLGPDAAGAVPKLIKVFAEPLRSQTPEDEYLPLRLKVIETLGAIGEASKAAVPELTKLLKPGWPERIHAAYALGKMGPAAKPAIPELLEQAAGNDYGHFTTAMAELGEVMRPYIVADLESNEESRQIRSLQTLMGMAENGDFALPQVRESIKSPSRTVRENCVVAITRMGPAGQAAVPELEIVLTDENTWLRCVAAQAIVQLKPDHVAARETLVELLVDDEMSQHAMTGLWSVGKYGTAAIAKLEAIIEKTSDPYLRTRAAVTLWIVHPESKIAPTVVREMLQDKNYEVRGSAAALVGRVGANAKPILDVLCPMLHDENGSVQTWAKGSVDQIEAALKSSKE